MQAELGWKVLYTLVLSRLATADDSDIMQVVSEHVALGETGQEGNGEDEERIDGPPPASGA